MTKRSEFSRKTKVEAFAKCGGFCEKCSVRLMPGKFHYDHEIPDALGGKNVLDNCKVVCTACHGEKTANEDVPRIAKAKRQEAAHIGAKMRGQSFNKPTPQRRASKALTKVIPKGQGLYK